LIQLEERRKTKKRREEVGQKKTPLGLTGEEPEQKKKSWGTDTLNERGKFTKARRTPKKCRRDGNQRKKGG